MDTPNQNTPVSTVMTAQSQNVDNVDMVSVDLDHTIIANHQTQHDSTCSTKADESSILSEFESTFMDSTIKDDPTMYECSQPQQINSMGTTGTGSADDLRLVLTKQPKLNRDKAVQLPTQLGKKRKLSSSDRSFSDSNINYAETSTPRRGTALPQRKPCIECKSSTIMDDSCAVTCNFCLNPVCNACSAVPLQLISTLDHHLLENYLYTCERCKSTLNKGKLLQAQASDDKFDLLSQRMDNLTGQMASLTTVLGKMQDNYSNVLQQMDNKAEKSTVTKLSKEIVDLKTRTVSKDDLEGAIVKLRNDLQPKIAAGQQSAAGVDMVTAKIRELKEDLMEEEKRKSNLIYYGVRESKGQSGAERKKHDEDNLFEFLTRNLDMLEPPRPRNISRLPSHPNPAQPDAPRPMKVVFKNTQDKFECMNNYIAVKNNDPGRLEGIACSHDRTKKQADRYKELRKEVEDREKKGEKGLKIRGDRIVLDQPFRGRRGGRKQ